MHVCVCICMYVYVHYMYIRRAAVPWRYNDIKRNIVYKKKIVCSVQPQLCHWSRKHTYGTPLVVQW